MLSFIHTKWLPCKASLWYLPILSYLIPYTVVGNSAGQLFPELKSLHFSSLAFTQSKCNADIVI